MAYYFVSQDSQSFGAFQKRFSFLAEGLSISNKAQLKKEISEIKEMAFFFVHYAGEKELLDELVLLIREKLSVSKIIYVIEKNNALDLKRHQMTPVGGDAYVYQGIDEETLVEILSDLRPPEINQQGNKLETEAEASPISDIEQLQLMKSNPVSQQIDEAFSSVIKEIIKKPKFQNADELNTVPVEEGETMSTKDNEIQIDGLEELELNIENSASAPAAPAEEGLELSLDDGLELSLAENGEEVPSLPQDDGINMDVGEEEGLELGDLSDEGGEEFSLSEETSEAPLEENLGELDLGLLDEAATAPEISDTSTGLKLDLDDSGDTGLSLSGDLSDDAKEKLKEIDAILDLDASQAAININLSATPEEEVASDLSLEPEADVSLDGLDFNTPAEAAAPIEQVRPQEIIAQNVSENSLTDIRPGRELGSEFKEISQAYSGEMERTQATIANLRADREELLAKIEKLEDDKVLHNRQVLSLRAELDEKKIELTIIRKKNNEEINELKDKIKLFDEKRLILEEKNKILQQELDKASQKNKLDVKKIQLHERELEQRLELLKSDAETQIRNRDLKILELKRKIDAMEFDMESISTQEKRSVESRYELEDKLEKAIKTLRNAITVPEDESDKGGALEALKKNIDM